jgi:hypothetical protein
MVLPFMAPSSESSQKIPIPANKKSATLFYKHAKPPLAAFKIPAPWLDFAEPPAQKQ